MNFTPEFLNATLEKYVFRTKFTEKDKEFILNQSNNIKKFDPERTLEHLIEKSEGRLDIYAPAEELWRNLKALVAFPKNAEFLGIRGNRVNFEDSHWVHDDQANTKFVLKSDVPLFLFQGLKPLQDEISIHLLKACTNKLFRRLENTHEYIPDIIVQDMLNMGRQAINKWHSDYSQQYTANCYNFVEYTPEEVFWTIAKFYDGENDREFLTELWEQVKITSHDIPIRSNLEGYRHVLIRCLYIEQFMHNSLYHFTHIFLPKPKNNKNFPHYPVIKVFEHNTKRYVLVKDLEFALINYENVKIEVETEEERRNGIIRTMEYHEFQKTLWQAGITENDIHMISHTFPKTKHGVNTPILTSYGTHCKLAEDAFCEVFRVFSMDINWFNTVSEKNYYKLIDWFNSISDVFSDTRVGLYLIDVWKIEELKNQAYDQFKKYTRKPKYVPSNIVRLMTKEDMYEEIIKFGSNLKRNDECWKAFWLDEQKERNMSKWDVLVMYDDYCLYQFTLESRKIAEFLVNHSSWYVFNSDYSILATRQKSLLNLVSMKNGKEVKQIPKFYNKLDAHRVGFLNEYIYSMSTITSECYYENDTCLKLALDKTIVDESVKSKLISLVYEAEMKKYENQRRSVFYLTQSECSIFGETTKRRFCGEVSRRLQKIRFLSEVMEQNDFTSVIDSNSENSATIEEKLREFRKIWKTHFPIDQYSKKFFESVQKIIKDEGNVEALMIVALKAKRVFEECSEKMRSFKDYCREKKERTIVMRIMCDIRMDDFNEWHMFSDEVLEAIEVVLENEGRLETMKEKLEKWRKSWNYGENFSTITVKLFKTILNVVEIDHSKFLFMPDVQFFKNYIDLPLKMGYNAMKIFSPDGREVYHQVQAQFLIFQYGACDVFWNSDSRKAKDKHKKKVMGEISKIGKGYTLAKPVEQSVRRVMYSDVAQKTALSAFHRKCYDQPLTDDEYRFINKCFPNRRIKKSGYSTFLIKSILMFILLETFFENVEDTEMRRNVMIALTMSFGFFHLENTDDFDKWCCSDWTQFECSKEQIIEYLMATKFKNESARSSFDEKELVEQHYLFDESDPMGTWAKEKKGRNQLHKNSKSKEKEKESDVKIINLFPKVIHSIADEIFKATQEMCWEMFEDYIQKEFDEEEAISLCKTLQTGPVNEQMKKQLLKYLDNENAEKIDKLKKAVGEPEKKVKVKKEEAPKVVVKYVTETKTVENCVNCRNIEKETMGFVKKIRDFEKEIEENQKIIKQKEEDLAMLKSQVSQNKLKYREEIQKYREDVEFRVAKIEQLNQEIREYREESKLEREQLYAEVRKSSRRAEESVKKMKVELENSKFLEKAKDKKLDELTAENSQLKTSLEIAEENLAESEKAREEAENRVNILKMENEEAIVCFKGSISDEELYSNPEIKIEDFDEILRIDVHENLEKICEISENYGISKMEIVRFQRRYDMYIKILENEKCWETAEIPDFPNPFSAGFMQNYERCLKENVMHFTTSVSDFFDLN